MYVRDPAPYVGWARRADPRYRGGEGPTLLVEFDVFDVFLGHGSGRLGQKFADQRPNVYRGGIGRGLAPAFGGTERQRGT